jgi:D-glycero-D-manno-heptose 1,7-bisphosphate phosphatase
VQVDVKSARAVFLDRDGVINRPVVRAGRPYPPDSLAQLEIFPDVPQALRALKAGGYRLIVVTNQPDVARGTIPKAVVDAIHARLESVLTLDAVLACTHDDDDRCECRKPLPGLITYASRELNIDCTASYMVGDRWRDIEAGRRAGCKTFFVDRAYEEAPPVSYDYRVGSLLEAAQIILREGSPA